MPGRRSLDVGDPVTHGLVDGILVWTLAHVKTRIQNRSLGPEPDTMPGEHRQGSLYRALQCPNPVNTYFENMPSPD